MICSLRRWLSIALISGAIQLMAAFVGTAPSLAEDVVHFNSITYRLSQFQRDRAKARGETGANAAGVTISGYLSKPETAGRFPAIILLHGCSGLGSGLRRAAELTRDGGYVVLAPDSFEARGIKDSCKPDQTYLSRMDDALGALVYLSKLEFVDPKRIAVVGYSQGGAASLKIASTSQRGVFEMPEDLWFKAAVAFYPSCEVVADELTIPTLVLNGELDDWSLASNCEALARRDKGGQLKLSIFPGAYHSFDAPAFAEGRQTFGHWSKYDEAAARRSTSDVRGFLASSIMQ